jgi:capsule polysaccharide export protein KpsE/RkpR
VGFVGLLTGTLLALWLPKRFESTTELMPPDNQSGSGMAMLASLSAKTGGGLGAFSGDLLGVKSSGALFVRILRSRTVDDRLVDRFQLKKAYGIQLEEDARRALAENTAISEDRRSGTITVTVTDRDPRRAAALAQAYVEELDRTVAQLSTSSARKEREFLEERLKAVHVDLESAEKEFSQFASKNTAIDIKEQGRAMVDAAANLEGELIAEKSELEGLKQIYTDDNLHIRFTRARVAELERQIEKIGGKGESSSLSDDTSPRDSFYPSIRKLPLLGVTYSDLYRHTKVEEAVFETLTQEYELAKVQEAKETPSVKVLDPAVVPQRKSYPPRRLIVFLCTFLALTGAATLALGRALWREMDVQDPLKLFTQEVFESVSAGMPWAPPNGSRPQAIAHKVWVKVVRRGDAPEEL